MRKLLLLLSFVIAIDHLLLDGELVINQIRRLAS